MKSSQEIRSELKNKLGYNSKQVSVRQNAHSTITFTVRDASVDFEAVEKFAAEFEKIDRCEYTHEILSGGNTFVYVRSTDEVKLALTAPYRETLRLAIENKQIENCGTQIAGIPNAFIWRLDSHTFSVSIADSEKNNMFTYCDTQNAASVESALTYMIMNMLNQMKHVRKSDTVEVETVAETVAEIEIDSSTTELQLLASISFYAARADVDMVVTLTDTLAELRKLKSQLQEITERASEAQREADALAEHIKEVELLARAKSAI
jgi:hypothetical protein